MILAGAGGHGLEVFDILRSMGQLRNLEIYDADQAKIQFKDQYAIQHQLSDLQGGDFCLGVGTPTHRKALYELFSTGGKKLFALRGNQSEISPDAAVEEVDIFHYCFIGPGVKIGRGTLINSRVHVHHEVEIGTFSVINPGALLLGAVQVGNFCSIGANATILPGIKIGNQVTIGAGAVVIRDVEDGRTVVGVPGREI